MASGSGHGRTTFPEPGDPSVARPRSPPRVSGLSWSEGTAMHHETLERLRHPHRFHPGHDHAERATLRVVVLTIAMMLLEIGAGLIFGSMALLADGWHMATHAVALGVAAFAYSYARRRAGDRRYSCGTGK